SVMVYDPARGERPDSAVSVSFDVDRSQRATLLLRRDPSGTDPLCRDALTFIGRVSIATQDGMLAESETVTLYALRGDWMYWDGKIPAAQIQGSFAVDDWVNTGAWPDEARTNFHLRVTGTSTPTGNQGLVGGGTEYTEGDAFTIDSFVIG